MRLGIWIPVTLALCTSAYLARPEPGVRQGQDEADTGARMARAMELMRPGDEHELLERFVGDWEQETTLSGGAGMPKMTAKSSMAAEMVLGGRFVRQRGSGQFMGMPVESITFLGFDRRHERYTLVGFDTMGTYYVTAAGLYDEETRTLTLSGTDDDPIMGGTQVYDFVFTFVSDDEITSKVVFYDEMHTRGQADSVTVVEARSTRRE